MCPGFEPAMAEEAGALARSVGTLVTVIETKSVQTAALVKGLTGGLPMVAPPELPPGKYDEYVSLPAGLAEGYVPPLSVANDSAEICVVRILAFTEAARALSCTPMK